MVSTVSSNVSEVNEITYLSVTITRDEFLMLCLENSMKQGYVPIGLSHINDRDERLKLYATLQALGLNEHNSNVENILNYHGETGNLYGFSIWNVEGHPCLCSGDFTQDYLCLPLQFKGKKWYVGDRVLERQEETIDATNPETQAVTKKQIIYFVLKAENLEFDLHDESYLIEEFKLRIDPKLQLIPSSNDPNKKFYPDFETVLSSITQKKGETEEQVLAKFAELLRKPSSGGGLSLKLSALTLPYALMGLPCPKFCLPVRSFTKGKTYENKKGEMVNEGYIVEVDPDYLPPVTPMEWVEKYQNYRQFEGITRFKIQPNFTASYPYFDQMADLMQQHIDQGTLLLWIEDYNRGKNGQINPTYYPKHRIQIGVRPTHSTSFPSVDIASLNLPMYEPEGASSNVPQLEAAPTVDTTAVEVDPYDDIPF